MKRKYVPIEQAIAWGKEQCTPYFDNDESAGICAVVSVTDMGYCRDGVTRWYHFDMDVRSNGRYVALITAGFLTAI